MALRVEIQTVPHRLQRYNTCGDWKRLGKVHYRIYVSDTKNDTYSALIGVHELVEALLCELRGIKQEDVDKFDMAFEAARQDGDDSEPGDDPAAPYRREHQFATKIERQLAEEMGVDWGEYEKSIYALG